MQVEMKTTAIDVINTKSIVKPCVLNETLFLRWVSFLEVKPRTIETYSKAVKYFLQWLTTNGIKAPVRADILKYRDELKTTHKPATVKSYVTAVKLFFQWTAQEGIYPNVAEHVKTAKLDRGFKKDYLTSSQAGAVLNTVRVSGKKGARDYAILSLMLTSGLRTIEVVRANIEDLRVVGDCTVLYIQGKGRDDKGDFVKVVPQVEMAIRAYLKTRCNVSPKEPLFTSISNNNNKGRLTTRALRGLCKDSLVEAGLKSNRLSAHSMRHTAATLNLLNGGTLEETQQLLRHQSINTTLIYAHSLERLKNKSEERVAKAIFGNE